jgi:Polyketide cyclase / dehydrase and lipid transport
MKRTLITIFLVGIAFSISAAESGQADDWKLAKQTDGISIYSRPHPGSKLKEFKAIGEVDASSTTVHKVIDDVAAYSSFMPYTKECRVIKQEENSIITYQRLSPRIVSDRDYTIRIRKKSWPEEKGLAYSNRWEQANEEGPPEQEGVFRIKLCEGSWLLEPAGPHKTRATYYVFSDSGINVPVFLANTISETGISKLFAAVRNQVKQSKYQAR